MYGKDYRTTDYGTPAADMGVKNNLMFWCLQVPVNDIWCQKNLGRSSESKEQGLGTRRGCPWGVCKRYIVTDNRWAQHVVRCEGRKVGAEVVGAMESKARSNRLGSETRERYLDVVKR